MNSIITQTVSPKCYCKYENTMCEFANDRGYCVKTGCSKRITINEKLFVNNKLVEVVRCKDCKYRKINEHFGEKGYMQLKAMCELDTGDPFELGRNAEDDDWFCADGERRTE